MKTRFSVTIFSGLLALGLSACATTGNSNNPTSVLNAAGTSTVAYQALGAGAVPIGTGVQIRAPGIYHIANNGAFIEICPKDFREIAALKSIQVEPAANASSLEDELNGLGLTFTIPGIATLTKPYSKIKVDGYTIKSAISGSSEDTSSYILSNVGEDCHDTVLPRNYPYIVVTSVAVADKLYTLKRGFIEGGGGIGPVGWQIANKEMTSAARVGVTFAAVGQVFAASPSK